MKTIAEGSLAPDFELPDQDGKPVALSTLLLDGPVVLFFYPAALTPGCTKEACHFRDLAAEFAAAKAVAPDPKVLAPLEPGSRGRRTAMVAICHVS